jgi:type III pantothenate kinase
LKLIIDIGNSKVKLALFLKKELVKTITINKITQKLISKFCLDVKIISSILSTVRDLSVLEKKIVKDLGCRILNLNMNFPITSRYKSMDSLGMDRLSAVIGASFNFPKKNILVFDAGTCLTMDCIDNNKNYLGGRISPGLSMRFKSLNHFTDKLPLLSSSNDSLLIGNDTKSSIISGVQNGIIAEVNSFISDYTKQNKDIVVIFTGGDYSFFEKELKISIFADPFLVLKGLNEILDFNE